MTTKQQVERELSISPRARQDDKWLQLAVWGTQGLHLTDEQVKLFLSDKIASPESIRRHRQRLQEQGKYLPPKPVQEARKELAEATRQQVREEKTLPRLDSFTVWGEEMEQIKWW